MEDVERVLRVLLQAADVTRAEFLQVKRGSHLAMHAAKVDLLGVGVGAELADVGWRRAWGWERG
jgi:hypothetical protein